MKRKLVNTTVWYTVIALALLVLTTLAACTEPSVNKEWLGECEQVTPNTGLWRCEIKDEAVCFMTNNNLVCRWHGDNNG